MKKSLLHIVFALSICSLALSCNTVFDIEQAEKESNHANVGFLISTGDGISNALIESVGGYENYLDVINGNFRFLIFDAADRYLETFTPDYVMPVDNSLYPEQYYVTGELSKAYSDFKLVVLANWPTYPNGLTVGETDLASVCMAGVYDYQAISSPFVPSAESPIPMYGVKTFAGFSFRSGLLTDLGTIDLLRAMAKVIVTCSSDDLSQVKLNNYRAKGKCAPIGMYGATIQSTAVNLNVVSTETVATASIPFTECADGSWVIYLPEYDNTLSASVPATVDLKIGDTIYPAAVRFGVYTDGSYTDTGFDILRNHCYKFNVVRTLNDLKLQYEVCDWDEVSIDIPSFE